MLLAPIVIAASPAAAQSPRDLLMHAAYEDRSRDVALARVDRARALALATVARSPGDQDAAVVAALALGYRAKLSGSRKDALAAKKQFENVAARYPRNPEALLGLAAWHLGIINRVGALVGRLAGAKRATGLSVLERSVALGGDRAMFAGLAGMMLVEHDPDDSRGRALVAKAARAPTPTALDRIVQRSAGQVVATLTRDASAAGPLAKRLLPFGWYQPK